MKDDEECNLFLHFERDIKKVKIDPLEGWKLKFVLIWTLGFQLSLNKTDG
jgi:hypothetical protein